MSDNPANINLRLVLDQAALQQGAAGVDKLSKNLTDLKATTQDAGQAGDSAASNIGQAMSNVSDGAADATKQVQELNSALETTSQTAAKVSASGGGLTGLRRTGSALTQLGLGDIGQPIQKIGDLGQVIKELGQVSTAAEASGLAPLVAAIGPLVIVGAGAAVAIEGLKAELGPATSAVNEAVAALDEYYKVIETGTTDTINKQITVLKDQIAGAQKEITTLQAPEKITSPLDPIKNALVNLIDPGIVNKIKELQTNVTTWQGQLDGLNRALSSTEVATNNAKAAQEAYSTSLISQDDKRAATLISNNNLLTSSSAQVKKTIDDNSGAIDIYKREQNALTAQFLAGSITLDDYNKKQAELKGKIDDLSESNANLTNNVLPLIKAREDETKAVQDATKAADDALKAAQQKQQKEVDTVTKYNDAVTAANEQAASAKLDANDKLNKAIESADASEADAELKANQKYHDALITAAQNAVEAASKALGSLEQKRADNLTSYQRDESKSQQDQQNQLLDDQIKAQRQEQTDLQTHLDNLKQIRDQDAARQQNDLLNRNFLDLTSLSFSKTQAMNNENDRYSNQETQLQTSLKNEEDDQARSFDRQRQDRLTAYQNANADALKQYNTELKNAQAAKTKALEVAQQADAKELQAAEDMHTKALQVAQAARIQELNLINQQTTDKLKLLYDGAVKELNLINQTEQQKQQIFQNALRQAQQLGNLSNPNNPTPTGRYKPFAAGGFIGAGQPALVNDGGGTEGFNGVKFPPGLGLFIPAQSGNVNPASGGKTINMSVTVNAARDPIATAQFVKEHVANALDKVMGN